MKKKLFNLGLKNKELLEEIRGLNEKVSFLKKQLENARERIYIYEEEANYHYLDRCEAYWNGYDKGYEDACLDDYLDDYLY